MNSLGARLEAALDFLKQVENNNLFADVGSDHAFLAIEAVKRGIAARAIASDVNIMPLEKGRENAEKQGIDVEFILSDGLDLLEGRGISSAAICGMGGELIADMVLRSEAAHGCKLILQPMTAQEDLRKALWENGFEIAKERFVVENGKAYVVMLAGFCGEKQDFNYVDLYLGKERSDSFEFRRYCRKIQAAAEKRRLGIIARGESAKAIDELIASMYLLSFSS